MPAQKPSATIHISDGAGSMRQIVDMRFETGEWPIQLKIRAKDAEAWMAHLTAEVEERGWNSGGISQLGSDENRGSLTVSVSNASPSSTLDIIWERRRDKRLQLQVRPSGSPILSLDILTSFIEAINTRLQARTTLRQHTRGFLVYDGLPWLGELWLDSNLRLGPPEKHPPSLIGPQAIVVDLMAEGIGRNGVTANFHSRLHELCVFLSFTLGLNVSVTKHEYCWVSYLNTESGITECKLMYGGYTETSAITAFPIAGSVRNIERREALRPGLGPYGIHLDMHEQWVPTDIQTLWTAFADLNRSMRTHLLRAGSAYMNAQLMPKDHRTARAAFLVVTCEALKPAGKRYDRMNIYDVVASLISREEAEGLRALDFGPQRVRSRHLHRGELSAGELSPMLLNDYFADPSFSQMYQVLYKVTRVCLIEWLRAGGKYKVVFLRNRKFRVTNWLMSYVRLIGTRGRGA